MPKTTMNEDNSLVHRKHKVRFARQRSVVNAVSKPIRVESMPQRQLRLRILATDAGHHAGTSLLVYDICHLHPSSAHHYERIGIGF